MSESQHNLPTIRTSQKDWLETALECYKEKQKFVLVDDRELGIREKDLTSAVKLIQKARKAEGLSAKQIATILTSLGLSSVGVWLILAAIADPEPTSKLGILIAGGIALVTLGGLSILRALGMTWRVTAHSKLASFTVEPK